MVCGRETNPQCKTWTDAAENMSDDDGNEAKPRFASHWLTIQPRLFPEWEREMERRDLEELEKREAEAAAARKAKRVSRASRRKPAPPR